MQKRDIFINNSRQTKVHRNAEDKFDPTLPIDESIQYDEY